MKNKQLDENRGKHPIQVVALRTGLSADAIRAWERRYQAVTPQRVSGGRRLYSDQDVKRLALLHRATNNGRRIGDIAQLSDAELAEFIQADESAQFDLATVPRSSGDSQVDAFLDAGLMALKKMEAAELKDILSQAVVELSTPILLEQLVSPLMTKIGDLWGDGKLRVSHEHLATPIVRALLIDMLQVASANTHRSAPKLLVATPAGQVHELGALMAAITAANLGWNIMNVAPNLPAVEIAAAAKTQSFKAIALSIVYPADEKLMRSELQLLRKLLPEKMAIVIGGKAMDVYRDTIQEINAIPLNNLNELRIELEKLANR